MKCNESLQLDFLISNLKGPIYKPKGTIMNSLIYLKLEIDEMTRLDSMHVIIIRAVNFFKSTLVPINFFNLYPLPHTTTNFSIATFTQNYINITNCLFAPLTVADSQILMHRRWLQILKY